MPRKPEIGNVQLYPNRPLKPSDKNGYVLKFYCPLIQKRIRKACGTRDRREARRILRECRERLLNGRYIESGGVITEELEVQMSVPQTTVRAGQPEFPSELTWEDCAEHYYEHQKKRLREKSWANAVSRIEIARRILSSSHHSIDLSESANIQEYITLSHLEFLQDRLLAGDESRYESRSPTTVNTMMGAVMAFLRYCHRHGWIEKIPPLEKLNVDELMKGRPVMTAEFQQMLGVVPEVVGEQAGESWKFVLQVIWESAFRIGDVMRFSWDDENQIHPVWSSDTNIHPTLRIPSTQKNGKAQEIPMLPGLQRLLEEVPQEGRAGWVVSPLLMEYRIRASSEWFKPTTFDLKKLIKDYNNSAIARACGVSETTVRKWLRKANIRRKQEFNRHQGEIDEDAIRKLRDRAERQSIRKAQRAEKRLSTERVSRIIAEIGKQAKIIVQQENKETGHRLKYATAHDLRRGCAHRLINAGVSAETLKVILRHKDFTTTEKFYGATRVAQSAAEEIHQKLSNESSQEARIEELSREELRKLKKLLDSL